MPKYLSGRSKVTPQSKLQSDRYRYLSIENAEPNLGDPLVGLSSVTAKPVPPGQQFIVVSVEGSTPGERYWIPNQGGIIPGSISVFDDNVLVGALSSITQLNFVGAAITASVSIASSNLATIRVFSPGNNQEIIFNTANEFSTSTKLKFDPSNGLLTAGDRIIVGAGGTVITTTGVGSVGIGTTNPTQELHLQGDLRLTGTIYDYNNQPGTNTQLLVKNNFGGLTWINQGTIRAGAGGTYQNIQFHNNAGLVDGAPNFVFDDVNNRIGIGSTQPKVILDVLGISSFRGQTTIDNLNVTGVTTTQNFRVTGVSTVGFVTGTSAFFTGIVTATKFVGELNVSQLYVTGVSTFLEKVNINSDLGVTGLTTTQNLQVYQSTTLNRLNATGVSTFATVDINGGEIDVTRIGTQNLNVSGIGTFSSQLNVNNLNVTGVGTFDNIKIDSNTISTNVGNLILDSSGGTTQINDAIFVNDATESNNKDTGSVVTQGGVGIEKNLNVGGQLNVGGATTLASLGGITTTGGDLYVKGDLYVSDDIFYDELFARNGYFTGITSTKDLNVTGIATIARLGVTGLTTTRDLQVTGFSTFTNTIDANGGAYIDNIQIGISADNEIDTSSGNLILDSAGGTVEITDQLTVSGITTISNTTDSTNKDTGALIVEGGVGIEKNLNVGGNVTLGDATSDTVTFNSRINSSVLPSTNGTLDLGGTSNRWSTIYATTFNGAFVGNADSASQVSAGTTTGTTTYFPTFVDSNNSTRENEFLYTDAGISYNPSIDLLTAGNLGVSGLTTTRNLIVSGISTFEGLLDANAGATIDNIQIGISADNEIDTSTGNLILDSAGGTTTLDDNVSIIGNLTVSGISTFQGNVTIGDANTDKVSFGATVDSNIIPSGTTRDLGSSSNKWNNVYANTFVGAITGNADTATKLATARNFSIDGNNNTSINAGDVSAATVSFDGSANVILRGSLKNVTGLSAGTYGDSITVPVVSVNSQGIVTSITSVGVNFSTATVANADKVAAVTRSTNATHYLTFVDSDNNPAAYESLYTDAGISYNPSTELLTATNLTVTTTSTFNGNVTLGDASADIISVNGSINTNVIPTGTRNLGSSINRWDTVYANTFDGNTRVTTTDLQTGNLLVTGIATVNGFFRPSVGSGVDKGIYWATDPGGGSGDEAFIRYYVESGENTRLHIGIKNDADDDIYLESSQVTTSSNLTVGGNLAVTGISTFNGNVTLGDATSDTVTFTSRINSNVLPSTNGTLDLGGPSNKWNNVYANTFVGAITGNADTATRASYADNAGISTNLKGGIASQIPYQTAANTTAFIPNGTLGQLLQSNGTSAPSWVTATDLTVSKASYADNAGISTNLKGGIASQIPYQSAANTTAFIPNGTSGQLLRSNGTSAPSWVTATDLTVSRASYADNAGISTNLKGGAAYQIPYQSSANTTLFIPNGSTTGQLLQYNSGSAPSWVTATDLTVSKASYADNAGISTNLKGGAAGSIPYQTGANVTTFLADPNVNGRILTWNDTTNAPIWSDPTAISVGTASSLNVTTDTSSSPRYLVLSSTTSGITTALVDSGITYTPSTDLLTVGKIKPTQIQDTGGGTGTENYVLTANGSGGWSWSSVTGGGSPAIAGITIQEEGSTVGTELGITTVNFVGASVTATSPSAGTANISITAASNVTVTQTGYACANPISVTDGSNIGIGTTSNAYGRRFIQTTAPTGACNGDIWYDTSASGSSSNVPAGTVIYYAASSAPTGYLKANGASLSTTTYATLFASIGYTFGGSGASFSVPDLRGEFARGWDDARGVDSGRAFGSFQDHQLQLHSHGNGAIHPADGTEQGQVGAPESFTAFNVQTTTSGTTGTFGTETRPRNIALLACIKY